MVLWVTYTCQKYVVPVDDQLTRIQYHRRETSVYSMVTRIFFVIKSIVVLILAGKCEQQAAQQSLNVQNMFLYWDWVKWDDGDILI